MPLTTLLFDLDGTLIDSVPDLQIALNKTLAVKGLPLLALNDVQNFVGNGAEKLVERAFRAQGQILSPESLEHQTHQFLTFYEGHEHDQTRLYDGVRPTLEHLREQGYTLALCTNKPQAPTLAILDHFHLTPFFQEILGGDQGIVRKPAPDMLFALAARLNAAPHQCVMIGDSANDIEAAHGANMASIAVSYGYCKGRPEDLRASYIVQDFSEITSLKLLKK